MPGWKSCEIKGGGQYSVSDYIYFLATTFAPRLLRAAPFFTAFMDLTSYCVV